MQDIHGKKAQLGDTVVDRTVRKLFFFLKPADKIMQFRPGDILRQFMQDKASVCLFIHNFNVPFDNNQAERDLRMIKVKTKVSGCFRTEEGARDYLKIMSYVGTAHKQGYNAYEAIKNAISGHPDFIFE